MILTRQDTRLPRLLLHNGIRTMPTDIMEAVDLPLAISNEEECEAGFLQLQICPCLRESHFMCDQNPFLGIDRSTLETVHGLRAVP